MDFNPIYIDDLTGVLNRRYFYEHLKDEIKVAEMNNENLWLAMVDIDNFKSINDTYGHLAGDYIIREVASLFRKHLRVTDKIIRFGGDEFILLLSNAGIVSVFSIFKRIKDALAKRRFSTGILGLSIEVTISIGVAGYPDDTSDYEKLLSLADEALYVSKAKGKNTISVVSDIYPGTLIERDVLELFPFKKFIGREKEIEAIKDFFLNETVPVLFLKGDYGTGKSRLLSFCENLGFAYNYIPFTASAYDAKRNKIFYVLWRSFEEKYIDVFPEIYNWVEQTRRQISEDMDVDSYENYLKSEADIIFEDFFKRITKTNKIVFLIDDFHLLQEENLWPFLRLLSYAPDKIKMVVAFDGKEDDERLAPSLNILCEQFNTRTMIINPLSFAETKLFIEAIFQNKLNASEKAFEALCAVTKGFPLQIEELCKYMIITRTIFRAEKQWVLKNAPDNVAFSDFEYIVKARTRLLDENIVSEIHRLVASKELDKIWTSDIGIVKKGYLLDIVKSWQRLMIGKDPYFWVENFATYCVKMIHDFIVSEDTLPAAIEHKEIKSIDVKNDDLLSALTGHIKLALSSLNDVAQTQEMEKWFFLLAQGLKKKISPEDAIQLAKDIYPMTKEILSQAGIIHLSASAKGLSLNKKEISGKNAKALSEAMLENDIRTITLYYGIQEDDLILLFFFLFIHKDQRQGLHILDTEKVETNRGEAKLEAALSNLIAFVSEIKNGRAVSAAEARMMFKWLFSTLGLVSYLSMNDFEKALAIFSAFLQKNPAFFDIFLRLYCENSGNEVYEKALSYIIAKMPIAITAKTLGFLYQQRALSLGDLINAYNLIPDKDNKISFIEFIEKNGFIPKELILNFSGEFWYDTKNIEHKIKILLSYSEIDRWGLFYYIDLCGMIEKARELKRFDLANILTDAFISSLTSEQMLIANQGKIMDLAAFLAKTKQVQVMTKLLSVLMSMGKKAKTEIKNEIFYPLMLNLVCLCLDNFDGEAISEVLQDIKKEMPDVANKMAEDINVQVHAFPLANSILSSTQVTNINRLSISNIFLIGGCVARYFLDRIMYMENVSKMGYFEAFWLRRTTGSLIPAEIKEEVLVWLGRYLKDDKWYVVRNAMELLSYLIDPQDIHMLGPLTAYPDKRIQSRLVFILNRFGTYEAYKLMKEIFEYTDDVVLKTKITKILSKSHNPEIKEWIENQMTYGLGV